MKTAKIMYSQGAEEKHYTLRNQLTSKQIRQKVYSQAIFLKTSQARANLMEQQNKKKENKTSLLECQANIIQKLRRCLDQYIKLAKMFGISCNYHIYIQRS